MNKQEYAISMINFHSRLLIKWTRYLSKQTETSKKTAKNDVIKGQICLFDKKGK